ncbi:MAG: hypothetical protein ACRD7E_14705 [Bryobacteraceae bacterium]
MRPLVRQLFPAALLSAAVALLTVPAFAGPPLICHPYQIGDETSLPWDAGDGWNTPKASYDIRNLSRDTLDLLAPGRPVIVRMETLRRAAIYSAKDQTIMQDLASRLMMRALNAEAADKPDALAWFDAGYFAESIRQMATTTKSKMNSPAQGIDGYQYVKKSLVLGAEGPAVEYALALIKGAPWPNEHFRKAVAGASEGSLLARNLLRHSGNQARNLDELRMTHRVAGR